MFDDIIMQLDDMGAQYTEDYETGSLTVDVGALDKLTLINVIQLANDSGLDFTIDEASMVIQTGAPAELPPLPGEEGVEGDSFEGDPRGVALDDFQF